ncbi:uncharacterized protein Hap1MRO34_000751 [Clarias gariepinus]|uniref:uncharacterized protein si:ch211-269k10.4 n=1 Tax=Clarias gariepinus TaxID=13013 RepID=UPI00234C9D91|nr:uncharacterized protein si:ch211-269k10.4 [Clarias gariepinus]
MASVNIAMDVIEDQSGKRGQEGDEGPLIKHYRVSELIPAPELPLHKLLKKEPAVWASVQVCSGVLSLGIGVMFAASFKIEDFFLTLFRVPIVTGIMFLVAGTLSMLLYRHPALLQICFHSNIFCLCLSMIGAVLLSVDIGGTKPNSNPPTPESLSSQARQVEIMVLCVTVLDMMVSIVLVLLIHAEKRRKAKQ